MIIPVRCFTCGKVGHAAGSSQVVGNKWKPYMELLGEGVEIK